MKKKFYKFTPRRPVTLETRERIQYLEDCMNEEANAYEMEKLIWDRLEFETNRLIYGDGLYPIDGGKR